MQNFWQSRVNHYIALHARPLAYDETHQTFFGAKGVWHVHSHALCTAVMGDYKSFSNAYMPKVEGNPLANSINQMDPPRHRFLRKILSQSLTLARVEEMTPWIHTIAHQLLDAVNPHEGFDYVKDFAGPFPSVVINHLLGIGYENSQQVSSWVDTILAPPDGEDIQAIMMVKQQVMGQMMQFFQELITARKSAPANDLLSALLQQDDDGIKLTEEEVFGTAMALIMAGNSTTSGLMANSVQYLLSRPDLQEKIRQKNDLDNILDELLRYCCPIQSHYRKANMNVQLAGETIKKGDILKVWIGAANFDPAVFSDPEQFNTDRPNINKQISFGHGIHYCIGEALGRVEANTALHALFSRFPDLRLASEGPIVMNDDSLVLFPSSLPIVAGTR
ncbi:cytochrome P450 [Chitinophaga qingshengii]|uniref:Cytochrome P450 n=1 Tax=Chitinophaga qingshengii TaxID=1569794 RepID=A0ABR7TLY3_9BACT|nr:cytochrome P450 [Chitinophaga qingshengii]MBC9931489.1 cytochrome P450 [Chitinophaga qingshengii]